MCSMDNKLKMMNPTANGSSPVVNGDVYKDANDNCLNEDQREEEFELMIERLLVVLQDPKFKGCPVKDTLVVEDYNCRFGCVPSGDWLNLLDDVPEIDRMVYNSGLVLLAIRSKLSRRLHAFYEKAKQNKIHQNEPGQVFGLAANESAEAERNGQSTTSNGSNNNVSGNCKFNEKGDAPATPPNSSSEKKIAKKCVSFGTSISVTVREFKISQEDVNQIINAENGHNSNSEEIDLNDIDPCQLDLSDVALLANGVSDIYNGKVEAKAKCNTPNMNPSGDGVVSNRNGVVSNRNGVVSNRSGVVSNGNGVVSNGDPVVSNGDPVVSNGDQVVSCGRIMDQCQSVLMPMDDIEENFLGRVVSAFDPYGFTVQIEDYTPMNAYFHDTLKLAVEKEMEDNPKTQSSVQDNALEAGFYAVCTDGAWHRAYVGTGARRRNGMHRAFLVDRGEYVMTHQLTPLPKAAFVMQMLAIRCVLTGIVPADPRDRAWSSRAANAFVDMIIGKTFQVNILRKPELWQEVGSACLPLIQVRLSNGEEDVAAKLVEGGYARFTN